VLYVLDKATGIAKEHSINEISFVMIAVSSKLWDLCLTVVYLFGLKGVENVEWIVSDMIKQCLISFFY